MLVRNVPRPLEAIYASQRINGAKVMPEASQRISGVTVMYGASQCTKRNTE